MPLHSRRRSMTFRRAKEAVKNRHNHCVVKWLRPPTTRSSAKSAPVTAPRCHSNVHWWLCAILLRAQCSAASPARRRQGGKPAGRQKEPIDALRVAREETLGAHILTCGVVLRYPPPLQHLRYTGVSVLCNRPTAISCSASYYQRGNMRV